MLPGAPSCLLVFDSGIGSFVSSNKTVKPIGVWRVASKVQALQPGVGSYFMILSSVTNRWREAEAESTLSGENGTSKPFRSGHLINSFA